ncbi:hypothetical protein AB0F72_22750 [Actinoplanes sp. NPDC023936]|uniref:hypothetical protein n=1 Tax=Actinoplanes sp. NPDC023936 TaxID=3154910 RepID=UPI0034106D4E
MTALSGPGVPARRHHLIALPRGRPPAPPVRAPESARRHLIALPRTRPPDPAGPLLAFPPAPATADRRPAIAVTLSFLVLALLCGAALTAIRLLLS